MGKDTKISWCDSTVNPTSGCQGCELHVPGKGGPCYAGLIHARYGPSKAYPGPFTQVDMQPGRMAQAAAWPDLAGNPHPGKPHLDGLPRVIFVGDMGDVFSADVPFEYLRDEVIANIASAKGRRHLWLILTKQPRRAAQFAAWLEDRGVAWPDNIMTGTSVTTQATVSRISDLLGVPGRRFVSAEPLWEAVDLTAAWWKTNGCSEADYAFEAWVGIDLVIVGAQSGPGARPMHNDWARSLRDQCVSAGVPFFYKQQIIDGRKVELPELDGRRWAEFPAPREAVAP